MTASARDSHVVLDLSREEKWVVHAALLAHLERAAADDRSAPEALDLLARLEEEPVLEFDDDALALLRNALVEYLADAPLRDRASCRDVLADVRSVSPEGSG